MITHACMHIRTYVCIHTYYVDDINAYMFVYVLKPIIAYVHTLVNRKSIIESKVSMIYTGVIGSGL